MATGLTSYKIYRSFRLVVPHADPVSFELSTPFKSAITPKDINLSGLSFYSEETLELYQEVELKIAYHSWLFTRKAQIKGHVVRLFSHPENPQLKGYAIFIGKSEREAVAKFLESYISSFNAKRLKQYLADSAAAEKCYTMGDALEVYSLYLGLLSDLADSKENAPERKIQLIQESMKAEAVITYLFDSTKEKLIPEYWHGQVETPVPIPFREGLPGMTFSSEETFNFTSAFNKLNGHFFKDMPEIRCSLSTVLYNQKREPIGVLQVINKRNSSLFDEDDEASLQLFARILERHFADHVGAPRCELSEVLTGDSVMIKALREAVLKLKETSRPLLITGEKGLGKTKLARWIHRNGQFAAHELLYFEGGGAEELEVLKSVVEAQKKATIIWKNLLHTTKDFQTSAFSLLEQFAGKAIFVERTPPDPKLAHWDAPLVHFMTRGHLHLTPLRSRPEDIIPTANQILTSLCEKNKMPLKVFSTTTLKALSKAHLPRNQSELWEQILKEFNAQLSDQVLDLHYLSPPQGTSGDTTKALIQASDLSLPLAKRMLLLKQALELSSVKGKKVS